MSIYQGLQTEVINFTGHQGYKSEAYYSRPGRPGKFPAVLVLHHIIAWDEWTTEVTRKFAHNGLCSDRAQSVRAFRRRQRR